MLTAPLPLTLCLWIITAAHARAFAIMGAVNRARGETVKTFMGGKQQLQTIGSSKL